MKTFVLATLFENGFVPSDTVSGASCNFDVPGQAEDYAVSGKGGTGSILKQTQASNNCAFLRLGQVVGTDKVIDMAKRLGVRSDLKPVVSLPLGVFDITPIDMAAAYATFANDGIYNEPYYVDRIEDKNGKVLYQHEVKGVRVIDSQTARLVNATLEANVTGGTGKNAQIDGGQPAAGKTGTTNDSADVWFVGYTPQLSTAIWMGAPIDRISLAQAGLGGATGGRYPATTWGRYYSMLMDGQPTVDFIAPDETRRGKSVGKVPNEIGGGGSRRTSGSRGTGRGGGGGGGGGGTTSPTTPATPTTVPAGPGFGGGPTNGQGAGE
jgi:membrane peptidoglycan carboxypeptidase